MDNSYFVRMDNITFIGTIHSPLQQLKDCPLLENEGAPPALIRIAPEFRAALEGIKAGQKVWLLTWLHQGNRSTLKTKPRNNPAAAIKGVFATRSPDRPNPIGLHLVEITGFTESGELGVAQLEVLDGTPLIDIKPFLG
ncbi:MAG: tRNA (N6-threonylcarbamoyladenosine(37)-N6)-methyltransferase TrmO [Flavisolibacter sp.]